MYLFKRGYRIDFAFASSGKGFKLCCYMILVFCSCSRSVDTSRKVYISHANGVYTLYRNGVPFIVKGGAGYTQMARLQAIGGNTIRTWDTVNLGAILDEAAANNLAVIAGFYVPASGLLDYFYRDQKKVNAQYAAYRQVVRRYRHHPALLMWCLGNEVDFPFKPTYNKFYKAFNRLADMIHREDPDHPITTTIINFQFRSIMNICMKVPGIDIIAFNTFGELKKLQHKLNAYSWLWNGPFMILEWGIYSPQDAPLTAWAAPIENTSTKKAEQYRNLYKSYLPVNNPRFLGALTFYWGQKQESTPSWYSLFDTTGAATAMVGEMQALWTGSAPLHLAPALEYMLVNGKGAADNILLAPDMPQLAELKFQDSIQAALHIIWEVLDEDLNAENTIKPIKRMVSIHPQNKFRITFKTPAKEGPYRIYAWIYDEYGNVSTANTPFYVVGKKL